MTADSQFDLFISYADADRAWVDGYLLDAVAAAGINYHSESAFNLGVPRLLEFERAVQQSRRTLLIISPAYLAEDSTRFIDLLAQTHGLESATWPVIPLKLHPVTMPPRLAILTGLDATDPANWHAVIERLCDEFQRPLPAAIPKPECPYPGMRAFEENESDLFFGRDGEIQEVKNQLKMYPFTVVIGPSGSGKSSVVFAGLIPELRRTQLFGPGNWVVRRMRPGQKPLTTLESLIEGVSLDPRKAIASSIAAANGARLLLVVDQFEELFTQDGVDRLPFQKCLMSLVGIPEFYLVLTVRADFYPDLMSSPLWSQIRAHRQEVLPMGEPELRQTILMPAEKVNVLVESALVERMVADAAGEPGILPFVQETMRLLWDHVERRLLPLTAYETLVLPRRAYGKLAAGEKLSGLQVAIALHADSALAVLDEPQQKIARRIFLRLVQFGEGRADTRRQQPVRELASSDDDPAVFVATVRHLAAKRLLTLSGADDTPDTSVDIAHEALITGWYTLQRWIDERQEAELTRRRLEAKAKEWIRFGEGAGGLLDETELGEADRFMQSPDAADLGFDVALERLLENSRTALREAKEKAETARQRELALEIAARKAAQLRNRVAVVLLVILAGLTIFAFIQRQRAQASEHDLQIQSIFNLSKVSQYYLVTNQQLEALRTALQSARRLKQLKVGNAELPIEAVSALQQAVYGARERNRFQGHLAGVSSVALSPDGQLIASGSNDNTVKLWRADGSLVGTFAGHRKEVTEVDFSPDGQTIASTGFDRTIRFWDLEGKTKRVITIGDPNNDQDANWISSIAFSPDGQKIAAACADHTVKLWDVADEASPKIFTHQGKVVEVRFIPHSDLLASAGEDGLVVIWSLNGDKKQTIQAKSGQVLGLDISPDGQTIATAGEDKSIKLWSIDGVLKKTLGTQDDSALNVRFSRDGQALASAGKDGTVKLWNVADDSVQTFRGHQGPVSVVRFSNNSKTIFSAGEDGSIRLWSATDDLLVLKHGGPVNKVAFSPDGQMMATASDDQNIRIWRNDGSLLRSAPGHQGAVLSVNFSPDNRQFVSGGEDMKVRLWDLNGGVKILGEHSGVIRGVKFSPDGKTIASGSADKTIKLWSLDGQLLRSIDNLAESNSLSFSPDGQMIASASSDKTIKLWKNNGDLAQTLEGHTDSVLRVCFSTDGNLLASGSSDSTVRLWRRKGDKFELLSVLHGHGASVSSVSFSPTTNVLASGSNDKTIRFWSQAGDLLQTVRGQSDEIFDVSFSPSGKALMWADFSGRATIWNLDLDDLMARGCGLIKDYLRTNPSLDPGERHICDEVGASGSSGAR